MNSCSWNLRRCFKYLKVYIEFHSCASYIHMYFHTYIFIHVHTVFKYVCMYVCICLCIFTCRYTHFCSVCVYIYKKYVFFRVWILGYILVIFPSHHSKKMGIFLTFSDQKIAKKKPFTWNPPYASSVSIIGVQCFIPGGQKFGPVKINWERIKFCICKQQAENDPHLGGF